MQVFRNFKLHVIRVKAENKIFKIFRRLSYEGRTFQEFFPKQHNEIHWISI